jgi:hypothetical protein
MVGALLVLEGRFFPVSDDFVILSAFGAAEQEMHHMSLAALLVGEGSFFTYAVASSFCRRLVPLSRRCGF